MVEMFPIPTQIILDRGEKRQKMIATKMLNATFGFGAFRLGHRAACGVAVNAPRVRGFATGAADPNKELVVEYLEEENKGRKRH